MSIQANRVFSLGMALFFGGAIAGNLTACSASSPLENLSATAAPIVGGTNAAPGAYPNVVALVAMGPQGSALCTGTLVAPNVVVTAAHCVLPEEVGVATQQEVTDGTVVVFDRTSLDQGGGKIVSAATTLPQAQFDINNLGQHDIGIVTLTQRITDRQPAPIIREASQAAPGVSVTLVGYGISSVVGGQADQNSAGTENVLVNKSTIPCAQIGGSDAALLCFDQSDGKGSCNGDSGGPAFVTQNGTLTLAAMTSFGDQNCVQIGAYTRLTAEIAFFEQQMLKAGACDADGICTPACGAGTLPADPDCAGAPPPPSGGGTTGGGGNTGGGTTGGNPSSGTDGPEVGDPPGLTGGCSVGGIGGVGAGAQGAAGILVALALTSVALAGRGRRRRARARARQ